MFYDCHTYSLSKEDDIYSIVNYKNGGSFDSQAYYSVGIHPWRVADRDFQMPELDLVVQYATRKNVVAIGECGLDKFHDNLALQKDIFRKQVALANELKKPLIVHCVKAYADALSILKNAKVPVIIHGTNNKIDTLNAFLKRNYYFSFGASLLKEKAIARESILSIPDHLLLLETDEAEIPIQNIYTEAAKLKNISLEKITLQIEKNIKGIFGWE